MPAGAPAHRPPRGPTASVNGDHPSYVAPYTHPDRAAGLPLPPRELSTLSEPDLPSDTSRPAGAAPAGCYASVPPSIASCVSAQAWASAGSGGCVAARDSQRSRLARRRSEARSEVSSVDPFDSSPDIMRQDGLIIDEVGEGPGGRGGERHRDSDADFGAARVGSPSFLRRTAVRWREREIEAGRLRAAWMAMRLHTMLAREGRRAAARENEMEELHMANSRIGELAFTAATGDAAAAEAQRREVLSSLAPNYAARKAEERARDAETVARAAEGAVARLAGQCDRLAGAVGEQCAAARERRLMLDMWRRWVAPAADGEAPESGVVRERRARERVEEELRAVRSSLEKK
eukprot:scaffold2470_cov91-Isochrysis_galbana.AAC.1